MLHLPTPLHLLHHAQTYIPLIQLNFLSKCQPDPNATNVEMRRVRFFHFQFPCYYFLFLEKAV